MRSTILDNVLNECIGKFLVNSFCFTVERSEEFVVVVAVLSKTFVIVLLIVVFVQVDGVTAANDEIVFVILPNWIVVLVEVGKLFNIIALLWFVAGTILVGEGKQCMVLLDVPSGVTVVVANKNSEESKPDTNCEGLMKDVIA